MWYEIAPRLHILSSRYDRSNVALWVLAHPFGKRSSYSKVIQRPIASFEYSKTYIPSIRSFNLSRKLEQLTICFNVLPTSNRCYNDINCPRHRVYDCKRHWDRSINPPRPRSCLDRSETGKKNFFEHLLQTPGIDPGTFCAANRAHVAT